MWRGSIRYMYRIEWQLIFFEGVLYVRKIQLSSPRHNLFGLTFPQIRKVTAVQSFRTQCLKNLFPVFLGRIASDFGLPKCKLELEVKGNMLTVAILSCRPYPRSERVVIAPGQK